MREPVKLLLAAAAFNALSWIILIPVFQYPDEQAHFAQVQDLAEIGYVPTNFNDTSLEIQTAEKILGTERDSFGNNKFTYRPQYHLEYSQGFDGSAEFDLKSMPIDTRTQLVKREATLNPPLYYAVATIPYRLFYSQSLIDRIFAVRIFSAIIFLGMVLLAYKVAKEIFEENDFLALVLTSLVAAKPMLTFASTGVLPDALTNFLFTLVLFICLKIIKSGINLRLLIFLVLTITAGILTRQQFPIAILIAALPIAYQILNNWKKIPKPILAVSLIILPTAALILLEPLRPYISKIFTEFDPKQLNLLTSPQFKEHIIWTAKHTIAEVIPWYWGVYKWLSLTVPNINYQIINRLVIVAIIGIVIRFILALKDKKFHTHEIVLLFLIASSAVYFLVFLIWDFFPRLNYGYSFGIQGRYFFPLVVAHLAIIMAGLWQIAQVVFKKYAKFVILCIVFLMFLYNDISLAHVAASYYDTSDFSTFIREASQYKPQTFKGEIIYIIAAIAIIAQSFYLAALFKYAQKYQPR